MVVIHLKQETLQVGQEYTTKKEDRVYELKLVKNDSDLNCCCCFLGNEHLTRKTFI